MKLTLYDHVVYFFKIKIFENGDFFNYKTDFKMAAFSAICFVIEKPQKYPYRS